MAKKFRKSNMFKGKKPLAWVLSFAVVGALILALTWATTSPLSIEPEGGTASGNVTVTPTASGASGGYVQFGLLNSSLPAYIPTNFSTAPYYTTGSYDYQTGIGEGKFRTFCYPMAKTGTFDPIVYPGQTGVSHEHTFFGNTGINPSSTYSSLRTTGDSTCDGGPLNRTGYWMPTAHSVSNSAIVYPQMEIYYSQYDGTQLNAVQKLPPGLRMIAGWSTDSTVSLTDQHEAYWFCTSQDASHPSYQFPTCAAGDGITATVIFPDCWDGKNVDSANHRSHVAYEVYDSSGHSGCPTGYPVVIPIITEKFFFPPGSIYLSSDRFNGASFANGSTLHADWFGGWDDDAETSWFTNCIKGDKGCNGSMISPTKLLLNAPVQMPSAKTMIYTGP